MRDSDNSAAKSVSRSVVPGANRPADVDLVLVHGYGFPRWRGGPMRLADEWGLPALLADYEALTAEDPKSWAVPALIRRLVAEGRSFADLNA